MTGINPQKSPDLLSLWMSFPFNKASNALAWFRHSEGSSEPLKIKS